MKKNEISIEQIKEFNETGFLILRELFSSQEINDIKESFDLLWDISKTLNKTTNEINGAHFVFDKGDLNRIVWCGAVESKLLGYARDERITKPVSQLLGSNKLNQIINQAHFKMPGQKVAFKWHQDSEHRRYGTEMWKDINGEGSYVQTILAIDEMLPENGPLMCIPNSHKHGHLDLQNNSGWMSKIEEMDKVELVMQPGDLVLFGPYTVHSSQVNQSNSPRRILINGFAYPGANSRVYPGAGQGVEIEI